MSVSDGAYRGGFNGARASGACTGARRWRQLEAALERRARAVIDAYREGRRWPSG